MSQFKHLGNYEEYEKELRRLGWCLDCQGYGQDWNDGSPCQNCNGTGKFPYEDSNE